MHKFFSILGVFVVASIVGGCPSPKSVRDSFERKPGELPLHERHKRLLPPGAIKFDAKIITVFTDRSAIPGDPCATNPCLARIQVTMFHAFGYGVKGLQDGDFFRTQFKMTMSDTTIDGKRYRGLSEGDSFTGTGYMMATQDGDVLEVHDYE